ncbi:RHS repeat domain-containing protein [Aquimarina sp. 2304DJ70-9]|uniref:RHS repeat domain-containing protein n=1 Tax=Aquimarina penaris TaxID=3231044 RepID=UPI003461B0A6
MEKNNKLFFAVLICFQMLFIKGYCQSEYQYDPNGNLIEDDNKNIVSIAYNVLNLPKEIIFSDGRKIINTYSTDGKKISQKTIQSGGSIQAKKDYINNIVYTSDQLEYINTSEGYVEPQNNQFSYTYQHKDQVGNIRTSFSDSNGDGSADLVKEEKNYYPFGLQWQQSGIVIRGRQHNYGFGGKEEIKAFGLDWNDHGARMYDPAIARWNGIDQLSEKYYGQSPYNYVTNNPLLFNDPDGKDLRIFYQENGQEKFYIYKGGQPKDIPNDQYVQQVISAYQYNVKNGGGNFLKTAAHAKETVNIREVGGESIDQTNYLSSTYEHGSKYSHHREFYRGEVMKEARTIYWDPNGGLLTETGAVLSPATVLEHEAGHWVLRMFFPEIYQNILQKKGGDYSYIYEQIIVNSGEQKTAEANKEVKKGQPTRKSHRGKRIRTNGPTSTLPPSFEILEQIMQNIRNNNDTNEDQKL